MEYDLEEKKKEMRLKGELVDDEEDYEILSDSEDPSTCLICSQVMVDPMATKCGHMFCEKCILKHLATKSSCPSCKEPTNGILNAADKILKEKIKRREEASKKRKEQKKIESKYTPVSGWLIP